MIAAGIEDDQADPGAPGSQVAQQFLQRNTFTLDLRFPAILDVWNIAREKKVLAVNLNAMTGKEQCHFIAGFNSVQKCLPGRKKCTAREIVLQRHTIANRAKRAGNGACIIYRAQKLGPGAEIVIAVDADHKGAL